MSEIPEKLEDIKLQKLLFIVVMNQEANPLIKTLNLELDEAQKNNVMAEFYIGKLQHLSIHLIKPKVDPLFKCDSVATETASLITYIGITTINPDVVINVGSAGGITTSTLNVKQGEIYFAKSVQFIDRNIFLDFYLDYIKGKYPIFQVSNEICEKLQIKKADIGTTDSFELTNTKAKTLGISLVEMEGTAIAKVCYLHKKPLIIIKSISDVEQGTEEERAEQFTQSLDTISEHLATKVKDFVNILFNTCQKV